MYIIKKINKNLKFKKHNKKHLFINLMVYKIYII